MPILDSKMYSDKEVDAIKRGIHGYQGFEERCAKAATSGLTDEELKEWLGYELGEHGGSYSKEWVAVTVTGMSNPRIWLGDSWTNDEPPTLSGKHLLNVTRQLYGIGLPCPEGQLTLF
jgi:hypothetical protein